MRRNFPALPAAKASEWGEENPDSGAELSGAKRPLQLGATVFDSAAFLQRDALDVGFSSLE
jgi:hypothetical protein